LAIANFSIKNYDQYNLQNGDYSISLIYCDRTMFSSGDPTHYIALRSTPNQNKLEIIASQ